MDKKKKVILTTATSRRSVLQKLTFAGSTAVAWMLGSKTGWAQTKVRPTEKILTKARERVGLDTETMVTALRANYYRVGDDFIDGMSSEAAAKVANTICKDVRGVAKRVMLSEAYSREQRVKLKHMIHATEAEIQDAAQKVSETQMDIESVRKIVRTSVFSYYENLESLSLDSESSKGLN